MAKRVGIRDPEIARMVDRATWRVAIMCALMVGIVAPLIFAAGRI